MKTKNQFTKQLFSVFLCLAMLLTYVPISSLTAFAAYAYTDIIGDFTIAPSAGATDLTADTDYTYTDGVLTVNTTTPVTIGMRDGVTTTAETIVVDSTKGETSVTFDSIGIDTTEDAAIAATGANKVTFTFTGESALSAADGDGINVASNTPIVITSTASGKLGISGVEFGIFLDGYAPGGSVTISGDLKLDITDCISHAIYCRNTGSATISGTPVINIDTTKYAIYAHGIDISGGTLTVKNDDGYTITAASDTNITLSGSAEVHIMEGEGGLRSANGKIAITDSAKLKVYNLDDEGDKAAVIDYHPLISTGSSGEIEISEDAVVELYSANDAISGGKTSILDNAQVDIVIDTDSTYSEYAISFNDTLTISDTAKVDIDVIKGSKIHGLYGSSGTVNVSGSAVVKIDGTTYKGVYVKNLNLSEKASVTVNHKGNSSTYYGIDGDISVKDTATLTATSVDYRVLGDTCTVTPTDGKAYMVKYGTSEADATTDYYKKETAVSGKSTWRYFSVQATDAFPVTVSFDTNGGAAIDDITVTYGEKYGKLPSTSVTGLSGGDSNWYLVDESGNVTETKITSSTVVSTAQEHTLFAVRKVLAPTLKITLKAPGAISDNYQYYVPSNSTRILTVTVNNQNTDVLDYTYQWYKDDVAIEGATAATLTLDGNVSDAGTYKVKVTATLKDNSGIIVTEDTASAEKSQEVQIMHAANTLYYDANGGEGGPSSNYTGGTTITVSNTKPTREGFIFDGWNTEADGTGESYDGGATYTFAEDNGNGGCNVTLYAQWIKAYGVYAGGVQIIETNKDDVLGDGKVSYDAETNTLTLNGAEITGGYEYEKDCFAGIYAEGDLDIELIGENKVTAPDSATLSCGISVLGDLNISGGGNIVFNGGAAIAQDYEAISVGILGRGQLTIYEAAVTANGGSAVVNGEGVAMSNGVYIEGGLEVDFGGSLIAAGGKAQATQTYSYGIEAIRSEDDYINVSVYDGSLSAEGGEAVGVNLAACGGIYIYMGGLYLYETRSSADITSGKAVVTAEDQEETYTYSEGIYVYAGDVEIAAGKLDVSSGSYTGKNGDAYAIYVRSGKSVDDDGNPYSVGGYFTVGCEEVKPGTYSPSLVGTTVNINSSNGKAIYATAGIDISSKLTISVPENGEIKGIGGSTDPENWIQPDYWTILEADGAKAQNVTIDPLGYKVSISGLSNGMAVLVPAGQSINETYCEKYEVEDFSELLNTKKDGYTFGGWYTDEACTTGNEFDFDDSINADITIYAKWVPVTGDGDNAGDDDNKPSDGTQGDGDNAGDDDNKPSDGTQGGDGTVKNDGESTQNPQTGDKSNLWLRFALLFVSGGAVVMLTVYDRKRRIKNL